MAHEPSNLAREIVEEHGNKLALQAGHAVREGQALNEFVILVIDEADDDWRPLFDRLKETIGLSGMEDDEEHRIAMFTVTRDILPTIAKIIPEMAGPLMGDFPKDRFMAVILCEGRMMVRFLQPEFETIDRNSLC